MRRRRVVQAGLLAGSALLGLGSSASAQAGVVLHARHTGDVGALTLVDATLDGRALRMMVDTGASTVIVSPALARELGLQRLGRVPVATLGGTQEVDRVRLGALRVGDTALPGANALVVDLPALLGPALAGVDGLLGMPCWREQPLALDFTRRQLLLGTAALAALKDEPAWPLHTVAGLPVIELRLGDRAAAPFLFDTGNAGALVVFAAHARRLLADAPALPTLKVRELGGEVGAQLLRLERVAGAGFTASDVPAAFESGAGARRGGPFERLAGSFGTALLRGARVLLDAPGGQWRISPAILPTLPGGFGFMVADAPLRVSAVIEGGPAERAGLRPRDRLLGVDGQPLLERATHELWRALDGVDSAELEWQRDGQPPHRTVLRRERFFPLLR